jgi:hypothetical protein
MTMLMRTGTTSTTSGVGRRASIEVGKCTNEKSDKKKHYIDDNNDDGKLLRLLKFYA